jgi:hypothetical protein
MIDSGPPAIRERGDRSLDAREYGPRFPHRFENRSFHIVSSVMDLVDSFVHNRIDSRNLSFGSIRGVSPNLGESVRLVLCDIGNVFSIRGDFGRFGGDEGELWTVLARQFARSLEDRLNASDGGLHPHLHSGGNSEEKDQHHDHPHETQGRQADATGYHPAKCLIRHRDTILETCCSPTFI